VEGGKTLREGTRCAGFGVGASLEKGKTGISRKRGGVLPIKGWSMLRNCTPETMPEGLFNRGDRGWGIKPEKKRSGPNL